MLARAVISAYSGFSPLLVSSQHGLIKQPAAQVVGIGMNAVRFFILVLTVLCKRQISLS